MAAVLADVLLTSGLVDADQLGSAREHADKSGISVGKAVVDLGYVSEKELLQALAAELGMGYLDVAPHEVDATGAVMIPRALAEELTALPVGFGDNDEIVVVVANPAQASAVRARVEAETGLPVRLKLGPRKAILDAIRHFGRPEEAGEIGHVPPPVATVGNGGPSSSVSAVDMEGSLHLVEAEEEPIYHLDEILEELIELEASDLHLTTGVPPTVRRHGELEPLAGYDPLSARDLRKMIYGILTQRQREQFENNLELDMSYSLPGRARFRVNVFQQRDAIGVVMRVIPFEITSVEGLGLPPQVSDFAYAPRGFVVVTGTTGSGKSTTLAAILDVVNENRAAHIMTVEDPIEFLHRHKKSVVNQREVGTDTHGFSNALKHALRQDPDVILVGEMRDMETIQIALTAAETGHLVLGSLHTSDAPQTIDRIVDVFPPHQQEQIRVQLAGSLKGVVSQQLLKTADGKSRVAAAEIMVANSGVRNLIREGKTHQLYSVLQTGSEQGMVSMDQSLAQLVKAGKVDYDLALSRCHDHNDFNRLVGRA